MLRATEEVENAIAVLTQLELQRSDLEQEITAHRAARDAAQDAYEGGAISLVEVLDEDRQLLLARDQLALVAAGNARAAVATFRALGGGWELPARQAMRPDPVHDLAMAARDVGRLH